MARLLFREGEGGLRELVLKPGVNRLGRNEQNDHSINDPTVSGFHCEIEVGPDGVKVRDLGSTNGTFIDAVPVQEAVLCPGQKLQLGVVELDYPVEGETPVRATAGAVRPRIRLSGAAETENPAVLAAPPPPVETGLGGTDDCANHPGIRGEFTCQRCGKLFCRDCLKWLQTGMKSMPTCPACGGLCVKTDEYRRKVALESGTFFSLLPGAFSYPFKRNGLILLICGTVFLGFLDVAQSVLQRFSVGFLMLAYWIAIIMSTGFLFAFMQNIIVSSTNGEQEMPGWPEMSNFAEDILVPFLRLLAISLVCSGPGLVAMMVSPFVGIPVLLLGLFCMPMALLTVSLADSLAGLNPLVIFSGITKVLGPYLVTCFIFLAAVAMQQGSRKVLNLTGIPILPMFIGRFVVLYLVTVEMRILGLLYFTNKEKLAWFD